MVESSRVWLQKRGLEANCLTAHHVIMRLVSKQQKTSTNNVFSTRSVYCTEDLTETFTRLTLTKNEISDRLKYLDTGSFKRFGILKGTNMCLIVDDCETTGDKFGFRHFLNDLNELQAHQIDNCMTVSYQTLSKANTNLSQSTSKYSNVRNEISTTVVAKLCSFKSFCANLQSHGVKDRSVRKLFSQLSEFELLGFDAVCLILTNTPTDCWSAELSNGRLPVHIVFYNAKQVEPAWLSKFAKKESLTIHVFEDGKPITLSTDYQLLLTELEKVEYTLRLVENLQMGEITIDCHREIDTINRDTLKKICCKQHGYTNLLLLNVPPIMFTPLSFTSADNNWDNFTSVQWLETNGLKAKKLKLLQILAPNSFPAVEQYVGILRKSVVAQTLKKALVQIPWLDGSSNNIHIDVNGLKVYVASLKQISNDFQTRMNWLNSDSRKIWGNTCEENVVIMLDLSERSMVVHCSITDHLKHLMEEQFKGNRKFMLMCFNGSTESYSPDFCVTSAANVNSAFKWYLSNCCCKQRDFKSSLLKFTDSMQTKPSCGIYIYLSSPLSATELCKESEIEYIRNTVGPDSTVNIVLNNMDSSKIFAEDSMNGTFDDIRATRDFCAKLNGRFHCFNENGIEFSDDITQIQAEMDLAESYENKVRLLVEMLEKKHVVEHHSKDKPPLTEPKLPAITTQPDCKVPSDANETKEKKVGISITQRKSLRCKSVRAIPKKVEQQNYHLSVAKSASVKSIRSKSSSTSRERPKSKTNEAVKDAQAGTSNASKVKKRQKRKVTDSVQKPEFLPVSTKDWLLKYGLKAKKLEFKALKDSLCPHTCSPERFPDGKEELFCPKFLSFVKNDQVFHFLLEGRTVWVIIRAFEKLVGLLEKRIKWLLSGSIRVFGILETSKGLVIVLDGSNELNWKSSELKAHFLGLLKEQIVPNSISFTVVWFGGKVRCFKPYVEVPTKELPSVIDQWVSHLDDTGKIPGKQMFEAITTAASIEYVDTIMLISDSCSTVEPQQFTTELTTKNVKLNCVVLNCSNEKNFGFLKNLAQVCGGSFTYYNDTCVDNKSDCQAANSKPQSTDLIQLTEELNKAKANMERVVQANNFISKRL